MTGIEGSIICITGGAGFIGINLTHRLLELNPEKIFIIDNLSSGNKKFIPSDDRIQFIHCDISNYEKYKESFPKKVDYIFHLAAHFANQNSVEYPVSDTETNIIGTINTLNISKALDIKKLIYASSSCVYGHNPQMKEDSYLYPTETPYAINKLCAEMYVKYFSDMFNLPCLSIRIFNTFGPYELPGHYRNVIPNFIKLALRGEPITITGTGKETRDFTYVDDTSDLMIKMCVHDLSDGSVFNGGTGKPTEIDYLAKKIIELTDSKSEIVYKSRRKWDKVGHRLSDIGLSKEMFKYKPEVSFIDGLQKTVNWLKKNI